MDENKRNPPFTTPKYSSSTSTSSSETGSSLHIDTSDEFNLLEYLYVIVRHKRWIIASMLLGLIIGYIAAKFKGPTWTSEVLIAAKESEAQRNPNVAGLGALGGFVANQLNIAANPGLDKIDLILDSRKFNAEVISTNHLLPLLYKSAWPKKYYTLYDTLNKKWNDTFVQPNMLQIGGFVKNAYLKKEINNNNTMTITISSPDSLLTDTLISLCLNHLNIFIQSDVKKETQDNISYLENKLLSVADPLLREKLQNMIAMEMEKVMLVSKESFKIIDPKILSRQFKEKNTYPLMFSFGISFITIVLIVVIHALKNSINDKTTREYINRIVKAVLRF